MTPHSSSSGDWRDRAACLAVDPEIFFPVGTTGPALDQIDDAKAVCLGWCIVRKDCREFALRTRQQYGVWGGLDEDERRAMLRRASRARAGSAS